MFELVTGMDFPPGMSSWVTIFPMMSSSKEKLSSMSSTSPSYLLMKVNDLYRSGSSDGNSSMELVRWEWRGELDYTIKVTTIVTMVQNCKKIAI